MQHRRHPRAKLTPQGRKLLVQRVREDGWPVARAAEAQGVSRATAHRWLARFDAEGEAGLLDRSSRPHRSPGRLSRQRERAILRRRDETLEGPHRIAWALGEAPSTVHAVLRRHGVPRLCDLDRATRTIVRYQREHPGELIHVDVKKQGRIPDGGGWRAHGRGPGVSRMSVQEPTQRRPDRTHRLGYDYLHIAVDDRSRIAYAEAHRDERKETAAGFIQRAIAWYATHGITVQRVMTDNGACYRSHTFRDALAHAEVKHKRTRPRRPQTNGKVERFNLTLKLEWAYAAVYTSNQARLDDLDGWLHHYNWHRPHYAHQGGTPMACVTDVPGKHS
jgi:transposase InsO family protein